MGLVMCRPETGLRRRTEHLSILAFGNHREITPRVNSFRFDERRRFYQVFDDDRFLAARRAEFNLSHGRLCLRFFACAWFAGSFLAAGGTLFFTC